MTIDSEAVPQGEEREEEFDASLTDEELLKQISAWEKESEEYYEVLKRIWARNLDYYKGIQTDVDRIYGKESKAVENRIWMAVETMIPIATSRLPDIVVRSENEDEQSQMDAQDLQDILGFHMERVGMQELAERFLRDMAVKRYGVLKAVWDKDKDDVGVRLVDPRRIRVPKYGKNICELKYIIEDLELSYEQIESEFGKDKAEELNKTSTKDSEMKKRKQTFSVKEVWTSGYRAFATDTKILKKEKNPYWRKSGKNFLEEARMPYVIKSLFHTEESVIGDTDYIQQTIPIQDNINIIKRRIENLARKIANAPLLIDSDVMSEEQASAITNEEGIIIYGKDAASGTKIRFEQPGQIPQYLFQELQLSRQEFDNIWGVHSTTRGERQGRETLGGRKLLRQGDLGRIDGISRQFERAMDEVAELWTQMIMMFYTDEKSFSILGEDGVRFIRKFKGDKVGNVRLVVKPGSTLPRDEITIHDEAIQLWQQKAIGVRTLYKMLRLPDVQGAMDDFIDTQSGRILQQGQSQAGQVMPPGTPTGLPGLSPEGLQQ